jgi:hypothetical protein
MGRNVHVVKKQETYGKGEYFNYSSDAFYELLDLLACEPWGNDDACPDRFECSVEKFEKALDALKEHRKKFPNSESLEWVWSDGFESPLFALLEEGNYSDSFASAVGRFDAIMEEMDGIELVIRCMEKMYKERDKKSDTIQFVVW